MMILHLLQDAQQRSWAPALPADHSIDEVSIQFGGQRRRTVIHWPTPAMDRPMPRYAVPFANGSVLRLMGKW